MEKLELVKIDTTSFGIYAEGEESAEDAYAFITLTEQDFCGPYILLSFNLDHLGGGLTLEDLKQITEIAEQVENAHKDRCKSFECVIDNINAVERVIHN